MLMLDGSCGIIGRKQGNKAGNKDFLLFTRKLIGMLESNKRRAFGTADSVP